MPVENPVPVRPVHALDRAAAREQGRSRRRVVSRTMLAHLTVAGRDPIGLLNAPDAPCN